MHVFAIYTRDPNPKTQTTYIACWEPGQEARGKWSLSKQFHIYNSLPSALAKLHPLSDQRQLWGLTGA